MYPEFPRSHDAYFKFVFQDLARAQYFFKTFLPPKLCALLDLDTLAPTKESFVTDDLTRHYSDLVFTCRTCENASMRICLLLEHKSSPSRFERLQLLQYMLNIWNSQSGTQSILDGIIPVVFYHGPLKWSPQPFASDFGKVDLNYLPYLPEFQYHFINLLEMDESRFIAQFNSVHAALSLLRNIWSEQDVLQQFIRVSAHLVTDGNLFKASIVYIYSRYQFNNQKIMDLKDQLPPQAQEPFFSTYDRLISEGYTSGRTALLTEQINYHFNEKGLTIPVIADLLRVSEEEVERILRELGK